jgi:hypothetical protein
MNHLSINGIHFKKNIEFLICTSKNFLLERPYLRRILNKCFRKNSKRPIMGFCRHFRTEMVNLMIHI